MREYVTVKELIELLGECNQDNIVLLAGDSEGNYYMPFSGDYSQAEYTDGEVYHPGDEEWYRDEQNKHSVVPNAVVLWP